VEPLSLAIRVLAGHHFPKRVSPAIAILGLFRQVIVKLIPLNWNSGFPGFDPRPSPLQQFFFGFVFILILEFSEELA